MVFRKHSNLEYIFSLYLNFSISLTLVYVKITYSVVSVNGIKRNNAVQEQMEHFSLIALFIELLS